MPKNTIDFPSSIESRTLKFEELARWERHYDIFICCASFETRSLAVTEHLNLSSIDRAIVFNNSDLSGFNETVRGKIHELFSDRVEEIAFNSDKPVETDRRISQLWQELPQAKSILIDITTFTRETLLILLNSLRKYIISSEKYPDFVTLIYTPAGGYFNGSGRSLNQVHLSNEPASEAETPDVSGEQGLVGLHSHRWLTRGVREIRSVIGFPGEIIPSRPFHLIILSGYESERADRLIEMFEPRFLSIGCGTPEGSFQNEFYEENIKFKNKISALYGNLNEFDFWPNDPIRTLDALEGELKRYVGSNIVVAPLNTKVSTLGVALFAWRHPSVQVCYAQGDLYNYENYAWPSTHVCLFEVANWFRSFEVEDESN